MLEVEGRDGEDYRPDMPPLEEAVYLIGPFYEIGPTLAGGSGPITQGELRHWQENTGIDLQPWESRMLRRLSNEYLSESIRAAELGCIPPWIAPDFKPEPTAAQLALRALASK